jgi:N-acetylmuramoyl-L-alanine amidase
MRKRMRAVPAQQEIRGCGLQTAGFGPERSGFRLKPEARSSKPSEACYIGCVLALALAAFTVVLDPGHGGSNLGALGVVPTAYEKRLTLKLARLVEARLKAGGITVRMTRTTDTFLTLRERVRRANAWAPDLFVSLHFNASPDRSQRGTEAYVLDIAGSELEVRRAGAAAREGAGGAHAAEVEAIRAEHALDQARDFSTRAARRVQQRVCTALADSSGSPRAALDRGVRPGALDVLRGVRVPAVLAELAFIDHPVEGREILRPQVQANLADAVAGAILELAREHEQDKDKPR